MCPAGDIKKPKGGRPGQALVPHEKVSQLLEHAEDQPDTQGESRGLSTL